MEGNIKMELQGFRWENVDWIYWAQGKVQEGAVVSTVMNTLAA